jgi:hypothetical protein
VKGLKAFFRKQIYFLRLVPAEAKLTKPIGIEISEEGASFPAHEEIISIASRFKRTGYVPVTIRFVRKHAAGSTLKADAWDDLRGSGYRGRRNGLGYCGGCGGTCFYRPRPLASRHHELWQAKLPLFVESVILRARFLDGVCACALEVRTAIVGVRESPALIGTRYFALLSIVVKHLVLRTLRNRNLVKRDGYFAFRGNWEADHIIRRVVGDLGRCCVVPFAPVLAILAIRLLGIVARVRIRAYPAVCIEFLVTFP